MLSETFTLIRLSIIMYIKGIFLFTTVCLFLFFAANIFSQSPSVQTHSPTDVGFYQSNDDSTIVSWMNINRLASAIRNDGSSECYDISSTHYYSFEYPKGLVKNWGQAGLIVGGKYEDEIRVEGIYYHSSFVSSIGGRIFRVRKDYVTGNLAAEIQSGEGTESEIRNKYAVDWQQWPANTGAPFDDVNSDGIYDPAIDIPGIPGADQTIWFTTVDSDTALAKKIFSSLPMNLEVQFTFWAYNNIDPLGNTIFRQYKIINKSAEPIREMYCSLFSDLDVGLSSDDYVGCDTTLGLAYIYNRIIPEYKYGNTPPAFGYIYLGDNSNGKKNIHVCAFNPFINSSNPFAFPNTQDYETSAKVWYRLFQGITEDGGNYKIPVDLGGGETKFPFAGNPGTNEGWNDGNPYIYNNRGMNLPVGVFDLSPNESISLTFALIAAGGEGGISNLNAIDTLKLFAAVVREKYELIKNVITNISYPHPVYNSDFHLYLNYPNPFNPSTIIKFTIPAETTRSVSMHVDLKIYDILGCAVATLVNGYKSSGTYEVKFDGHNLPSGVYICRLVSGNFSQSNKMILIK